MHRIKMRYSIEPRDRIFVKGYGFLSFAWVHMGTHATKVAKNLSNKYGQKLLNCGKKSTTSWNNKCFEKGCISPEERQQIIVELRLL